MGFDVTLTLLDALKVLNALEQAGGIELLNSGNTLKVRINYGSRQAQ